MTKAEQLIVMLCPWNIEEVEQFITKYEQQGLTLEDIYGELQQQLEDAGCHNAFDWDITRIEVKAR